MVELCILRSQGRIKFRRPIPKNIPVRAAISIFHGDAISRLPMRPAYSPSFAKRRKSPRVRHRFWLRRPLFLARQISTAFPNSARRRGGIFDGRPGDARRRIAPSVEDLRQSPPPCAPWAPPPSDRGRSRDLLPPFFGGVYHSPAIRAIEDRELLLL